MSQEVIELVVGRFRDIFGEKYDEFRDVMIRSGALCSGSFIIQCLLNKKWDDADIDIYLPRSDLLSPSPHSNPTSLLDGWLVGLGNTYQDYYAANRYGDYMSRGNCITWIRNYSYNNHRLQLIHTNLAVDELDDYIVDNYDFSICKNRFTMEGPKLLMEDYDGIMRKIFDFNYAGSLVSSIQRKTKYEKRGFKCNMGLTNKEIVEHITEYIYSNKDDNPYDYEITITNIDITHVNNMNYMNYRTFPYNTKYYNLRENLDEEVLKQINGRIDKPCEPCENSCIFTQTGIVHFHTNGSHIAYGRCKNLVVVNITPKQIDKDMKEEIIRTAIEYKCRPSGEHYQIAKNEFESLQSLQS